MRFDWIAKRTSKIFGSSVAFTMALVIILVWAVTGSLFEFSQTWHILINTITNIGSFLMIFLLQNTQNRDTEAIHLKLNEILLSLAASEKRLMDAESLSEAEMAERLAAYRLLAHGGGMHSEKALT